MPWEFAHDAVAPPTVIGRPKDVVGKDSERKLKLIAKAYDMPLKRELAAQEIASEYYGDRLAEAGSIKRKRQEMRIANRIELDGASAKSFFVSLFSAG